MLSKFFRTFKCKTLGDYHDLYLTTNTLLLACAFETFHKVCYETYALDCCQYFSAANLAGDEYLKICNLSVRLLEERENILRWQKILGAVVCPHFTQDFVKQLRVPSVSKSMQIISMRA